MLFQFLVTHVFELIAITFDDMLFEFVEIAYLSVESTAKRAKREFDYVLVLKLFEEMFIEFALIYIECALILTMLMLMEEVFADIFVEI